MPQTSVETSMRTSAHEEEAAERPVTSPPSKRRDTTKHQAAGVPIAAAAAAGPMSVRMQLERRAMIPPGDWLAASSASTPMVECPPKRSAQCGWNQGRACTSEPEEQASGDLQGTPSLVSAAWRRRVSSGAGSAFACARVPAPALPPAEVGISSASSTWPAGWCRRATTRPAHTHAVANGEADGPAALPRTSHLLLQLTADSAPKTTAEGDRRTPSKKRTDEWNNEFMREA